MASRCYAVDESIDLRYSQGRLTWDCVNKLLKCMHTLDNCLSNNQLDAQVFYAQRECTLSYASKLLELLGYDTSLIVLPHIPLLASTLDFLARLGAELLFYLRYTTKKYKTTATTNINYNFLGICLNCLPQASSLKGVFHLDISELCNKLYIFSSYLSAMQPLTLSPS